MSREMIFAALFAIFMTLSIGLGTLYYLELNERIELQNNYETLKAAFEDLEEKHNELLSNVENYLNSLAKIVVPIYNESGTIVAYKEIFVPTKNLSIENLTLPSVSGLIEVKVVIQYSPENYSVFEAYVIEGSDALAATLEVADVDYTIGQYGAFVNGINGVYSDWSGSGTWWSFWYWDSSSSTWKLSEVGPSLYKLKDGDTIAWVYTKGWPPEDTPQYVP